MIENLSQRDRTALIIGVVAVGLALLYFAVVVPYQGALHRLDTRIASRQQQLDQVRQLQTRYLGLQRQVSQAEQRLGQGGQLSLGSFLEDLAGHYTAKENLTAMRPQPAAVQGDLHKDAVEVHLEKVRLGQLVQLLYAIDTAKAFLKVETLHVKTRFDDKTLVDAVFTVAAYRRGA